MSGPRARWRALGAAVMVCGGLTYLAFMTSVAVHDDDASTATPNGLFIPVGLVLAIGGGVILMRGADVTELWLLGALIALVVTMALAPLSSITVVPLILSILTGGTALALGWIWLRHYRVRAAFLRADVHAVGVVRTVK